MNRIPTEGLKPPMPIRSRGLARGLNEQNPDRGIETIFAEGIFYNGGKLE